MTKKTELFGARHFTLKHLVLLRHPDGYATPGVTVENSRISNSGEIVTKCRIYNQLGYWEDSRYFNNYSISKLCYEFCKDDSRFNKAFIVLSKELKKDFDRYGWDIDFRWINRSLEDLLVLKDMDLHSEPNQRQLEIFAETINQIVLEHPDLPRISSNKALIFSIFPNLLQPFNFIYSIYNRWLYQVYKLGLVNLYYDADAHIDVIPGHNGFVLQEEEFAFLDINNPEKFNCVKVLEK
jgi:hypothetical protein